MQMLQEGIEGILMDWKPFTIEVGEEDYSRKEFKNKFKEFPLGVLIEELNKVDFM